MAEYLLLFHKIIVKYHPFHLGLLPKAFRHFRTGTQWSSCPKKWHSAHMCKRCNWQINALKLQDRKTKGFAIFISTETVIFKGRIPSSIVNLLKSKVKVKNDHRRKCSNLSNWVRVRKKPEKYQGFNGKPWYFSIPLKPWYFSGFFLPIA